MQFALQPACRLIRFDWIRTLAIETLEGALSLAAGRQRQDQESPALRAGRSFRLAHGTILPLTKTVVNFKIKLGTTKYG
jgi:hypothetical protein